MADPARVAASAALFLDGEPSNMLSLPTWAVHVSSVIEWCPCSGEHFVPACSIHFFCNSESLEVLVALQAALNVLDNVTMCLAAFRIYRSSEERSKKM